MTKEQLAKRLRSYLRQPGFGGLMLTRDELVVIMKALDPAWEPTLRTNAPEI